MREEMRLFIDTTLATRAAEPAITCEIIIECAGAGYHARDIFSRLDYTARKSDYRPARRKLSWRIKQFIC